jgi:hypothetical protein
MAVSRGTNAWSAHIVTYVVLEMANDSVEYAPSIFRVELPLTPTVDTVLYINVSVPLLASYHTTRYISRH